MTISQQKRIEWISHEQIKIKAFIDSFSEDWPPPELQNARGEMLKQAQAYLAALDFFMSESVTKARETARSPYATKKAIANGSWDAVRKYAREHPDEEFNARDIWDWVRENKIPFKIQRNGLGEDSRTSPLQIIRVTMARMADKTIPELLRVSSGIYTPLIVASDTREEKK
jgi:hypothetical protein